MQLPDRNHPVWKRLVTRELQIDLGFLAAKMLLMRLNISVSASGSVSSLQDAAFEIYNIYAKNIDLPSVKKDIELMQSK